MTGTSLSAGLPRNRFGMSSPEFNDIGSRWFAAMRAGDFAEAWRQTDRIESERRTREAAGLFVWEPHYLDWNGTPFDGRRVLVRCKHGLGDTLQFIRYVPLLRSRARSVTVHIQPQLVPLFAGCADFGEVRNGWTDAPPPYDVQVEIMELAYAFRSTQETLPKQVPYIPLENVRSCTDVLPRRSPGGGLRVGLIWAASDWDTTRSVPIEMLGPLCRAGGIQFYSLQQGNNRADWRRAAFPITALSRHTSDVTAAAAAMLEFDLIISVDSMTAHLAGALGRPVWLLLQHEPDWRWMTRRSDSAWYPTMRLFRQHTQGDWAPVVDDVATALHQLACTAAHAPSSTRLQRPAHSRASPAPTPGL
jgi:hypothetical protein